MCGVHLQPKRSGAMITETMRLESKLDAKVWACELGLSNDEQEARAAEWIWDSKPAIGCTYAEHPIAAMSEDEFWAIVDPAD